MMNSTARAHGSAHLVTAGLVVGGSLLMALSAKFAFHLPWNPLVPITLQTLAVALIGAALGSRLGALALLAYLAEGAAGLPVFTDPSTPAKLVGPTAGYLWAFPLAAFIIGYCFEHGWNRTLLTRCAAIFIGTTIVLLSGAAWIAHVVGPAKALAIGLLPFTPGDLLKILAGGLLAPYARDLVTRLRA